MVRAYKGICPNGDTDVHLLARGEANARVGYEVSFVRGEGVSVWKGVGRDTLTCSKTSNRDLKI